MVLFKAAENAESPSTHFFFQDVYTRDLAPQNHSRSKPFLKTVQMDPI